MTEDAWLYARLQLPSRLLKTTIYRLSGDDVHYCLWHMGLMQTLSEDELWDVIKYVERHLEIPWYEHISATIREYMYHKKEGEKP